MARGCEGGGGLVPGSLAWGTRVSYLDVWTTWTHREDRFGQYVGQVWNGYGPSWDPAFL
eukprot:XP_001696368.1 predicted protein [Chlamydomonas reinhardtii]